ncbi:MAG: DUF2857 family protein, partial [Nannocystaceae bacterium]|nr:DUF2857 family protein [Nannocystaceae bacterium]
KHFEDVFLVLGAPLCLMNHLFKMNASDFSRRRDALCLKGVGSGRPVLCDEQTDTYLWRLWQSHLVEVAPPLDPSGVSNVVAARLARTLLLALGAE